MLMSEFGIEQLKTLWFFEFCRQHGDSVFRTLAIADTNLAVGEVDILYSQAQTFHQAYPEPYIKLATSSGTPEGRWSIAATSSLVKTTGSRAGYPLGVAYIRTECVSRELTDSKMLSRDGAGVPNCDWLPPGRTDLLLASVASPTYTLFPLINSGLSQRFAIVRLKM